MKHCLVVDDSAVIRKVARRILEDMSFKTSEAENGRDALDQCRKSMPDVVLLDLVMPRMSGLEALPGIRRAATGVHVIVFTYHNSAEHVQAALVLHQRSGVDGPHPGHASLVRPSVRPVEG